MASGAIGVDSAGRTPARVGVHGGAARQGVVDADVEGRAGGHLRGARAGEQLGDVEAAEARGELHVNGEGPRVVDGPGRVLIGALQLGVVLVLQSGLDGPAVGGGHRGVVDVVVRVRGEGAGDGDRGPVAINGDREIEVSLGGVLVVSGGVGDLPVDVIAGRTGADVEPPLREVLGVGLTGAELVGDGDGGAGLSIQCDGSARPRQGVLELRGAEGDLPVHLLRGGGDVEGPLAQGLGRVVEAPVLGDAPAGDRHGGLLPVGVDRRSAVLSGLGGHDQCGALAVQAVEALPSEGVEGVVEGAGDVLGVHDALADLVIGAVVGHGHRLGQALAVAELAR